MDERGKLVVITLTKPNGAIEELSTVVTKDGTFDTILVESWIPGDYTLHASYAGNTIAKLTFFIGDKSTSTSQAACPTANCVSVESEPDKVLSAPVMIKLSGNFENIKTDIPIEITIVRPDNTTIELSSTLSPSGEFEPVIHSEQWIKGVHTVIVSYQGEQISAASFRR